MPWMVVEINGQSELLFVSAQELGTGERCPFEGLPPGIRDDQLVDPPKFLTEWLARQEHVEQLAHDLPPDDPRPEPDKEPEQLTPRRRPPRRARPAAGPDVRVMPNLGQPWLKWHEKDDTR